jgi:hypothetical protein
MIAAGKQPVLRLAKDDILYLVGNDDQIAALLFGELRMEMARGKLLLGRIESRPAPPVIDLLY